MEKSMELALDAAAVNYFKIRLHGRAARMAKKWNTVYEREQLSLNTSMHGNESFEEEINRIFDDYAPFEDSLADRLTLEQAMKKLTPQEKQVIIKLFWEDKQISQLCTELYVSRNTIQKTKRNALLKLRELIV